MNLNSLKQLKYGPLDFSKIGSNLAVICTELYHLRLILAFVVIYWGRVSLAEFWYNLLSSP